MAKSPFCPDYPILSNYLKRLIFNGDILIFLRRPLVLYCYIKKLDIPCSLIMT